VQANSFNGKEITRQHVLAVVLQRCRGQSGSTALMRMLERPLTANELAASFQKCIGLDEQNRFAQRFMKPPRLHLQAGCQGDEHQVFGMGPTSTPTATATAAHTTTATATRTVNQVPVASSDTYTVAARSTTTIAAPGVLANDTDSEGSPMTVLMLERINAPLSEIDTTVNTDGSLSIELANRVSAGQTFTYCYYLYDGANIVIGSLTNIITTNQPPVANPYTIPASDDFVTIPALAGLANDTDPEGSSLLVVVGGPLQNNGIRIQLDEAGSLRVLGMTPGQTATFAYRISDSVNILTSSVTIVVRSG
jgi:hypothetical protein